MDEEENTVSRDFPLFKPRAPKPAQNPKPDPITHEPSSTAEPHLERSTNSDAKFTDLGLAGWLLQTLSELGLKKPTLVQANCIPKILEGRDVLGLAQTGSGKTAAFYASFMSTLCPRHRSSSQIS